MPSLLPFFDASDDLMFRQLEIELGVYAIGLQSELEGELYGAGVMQPQMSAVQMQSSVVEAPAGKPGGQWALSVPDLVPSLVGSDREVLWAEGEALVIAGTDGAGKSTVAQQIALRQIGVIEGPLLGFDVTPRKKILYFALDRPSQSRRSLRRQISESDVDVLDERFVVIDTPIAQYLEDDPDQLVRFAVEHQADTIYVDSVKDVIKSPSEEVSGQALRRAYAVAIAEGVEVCLLHHDRKEAQGQRRKMLALADVYGSRFITAGAGSVIALNGSSGDPVVELRHLKQPDAEVGPLGVMFDFSTGGVSLYEGTDVLSVLRNAPGGLTAVDAARILYETQRPGKADKERARRKLQTLESKGLAFRREGSEKNEPDRFYAVAGQTPPEADRLDFGEDELPAIGASADARSWDGEIF